MDDEVTRQPASEDRATRIPSRGPIDLVFTAEVMARSGVLKSNFAEHARRLVMVRMHQSHQFGGGKVSRRPIPNRCRRFGAQASSPKRAMKRVAQVEFVGGIDKNEAGASGKASAGATDNRPFAKAVARLVLEIAG